MVSYAAPAPLQYAAPERHAAPTMTVTGIELNDIAFKMYSSDLDRLCRARVIRSFSPTRKTGELHTCISGDSDGNEHGRDDIPDVLQEPMLATEQLCSTVHPYIWSNK